MALTQQPILQLQDAIEMAVPEVSRAVLGKEPQIRLALCCLFTQLLLADEINRTTPCIQSALLEARGEGQVTDVSTPEQPGRDPGQPQSAHRRESIG